MKKKFILYNAIITTIALILMFALSLVVVKNNNYKQAESNIKSIAAVYAANYSADNEAFAKELDKDIRITVVAADGKVILDSKNVDVSALENHLQRDEIQSALKGNSAVSIRDSSTLSQKMMYYALKVDVSDTYVFVRIAKPLTSLNAYIVSSIPLSIAILLGAMLFTVILGIIMGNYPLKPLETVKGSLDAISKGKFKPIVASSRDKEVNQMLVEINTIGETLQINLAELAAEEAKLDYILNNISDAIIVLDSNADIQLINAKAQQMFEVKDDVIGKTANCLTSNEVFSENIIACAMQRQSRIFEFSADKLHYLCTAQNVEGQTRMTIIVVSNITASKNTEKMRSDFFANASHELKTPLTSIKGFNELMQLSNKDEKMDSYIAQIAKETDRMLALIDDMLKLSRLENKRKTEPKPLDVASVAREVALSLKPLAAARRINITVGGDGEIFAEHEHIYELIKNLAENAVKYNDESGKVNIEVADKGDRVVLEVSDNGIGIETKYQARIFERFYRVEKSRSRETGGTGLGLAIVKHIAELYNAELKLKSKLGVGTTVQVSFAKNAN